MIKFKLAGYSAVCLLALTSSGVFANEDCDQECRAAIEFHKDLDGKDRQIQLMQKEMEILRISKEIEELRGGSSASKDDSSDGEFSEAIKEISSRIDELQAQLALEVSEIKEVKKNERSHDGDLGFEISIDTSGIENVFVTSTSSVGGSWTARIFYNNSIQDLYIGEDVFPGAKIASIDRRGAVINYEGKKHHKGISPSEIAQARSFNNIKEERELKREQINLKRAASESQSFYSGY